MLISFTIKNWMSFKTESTLSMRKTREKQHNERIPHIKPKYNMKVLPIAAIYGGNASGKTNFCHALAFSRWMVTEGPQLNKKTTVNYFRLNPENKNKPVDFEFEILTGNNTIYIYSFSVDAKRVTKEKLTEVLSKREQVLFKRDMDQIEVFGSLKKDAFFDYAVQGTRRNQLFLNNTVTQNNEVFKPVFDWFSDNLIIIYPNAEYNAIGLSQQFDSLLLSSLNNILPYLDTGIQNIEMEETQIQRNELPKELKNEFFESLDEGKFIPIEQGLEQLVITAKDNNLIIMKLVSHHTDSADNKVKFNLGSESDGTRRLISLLPAFIGAASKNSRKVYVIDELDRSLHSLLTRCLVSKFLESCSPEKRSQLIFTTHDVSLLDQTLFRRDEIWVTERKMSGETEIYSFGEFKEMRDDKDIRKSYLQGFLGGIPQIPFTGFDNCQVK